MPARINTQKTQTSLEGKQKALKNLSDTGTCTFLNSSFDLKTASWQEPTLPEGTDVKKGQSPNNKPSSTQVGG